MRHTCGRYRLIPALLPLVLIAAAVALPLTALAASHDADLDAVLDGNKPGLTVVVSGIGGYYGRCMAGDFVNDTGQAIKVRVPVGLRLVPPDENVQTMVTAGAEILTIPPGTSRHEFVAFCSEAHDGGPAGSTGFSNGGFVDPDLMRVLNRIAAAQGMDAVAQRAVWSVTDGYPTEGYEGAEDYLDAPTVPAGQVAAGGLAAGAAAIGLAEVSRRLAETGGSAVAVGEGGYDEPSSDGDDIDVEREMASEESGGGEPPGEPPKDEPPKDEPPADEVKPDEKKDDKKKPPAPPKPLRAPDDEGIRWDKKNRRVLVDDGDTHVEAGRGGFWIGRGGRPETDPFELKPPRRMDVTDDGLSGRKRGGAFDLTVPVGDGKPPVQIYHDESANRTQVQRGHFVAGRQGDRVSVSDLLGGKRTGASYDGSKGDFEAFRANFRLSRTGDVFRVSEVEPGGRKLSASFDTRTQDFGLGIGDRWVQRSGDTYSVGTADRAVVYDAGRRLGGYSFPTNAGNGSVGIGVGADSQVAVSRTQPLRIGRREARLNLDYQRLQRESGGGLESEFSAGLDVGRVTVDWTQGNQPHVRYNWKF